MPHPAITAAELHALRAIAARHAATPHEADDIVQDVLLAALRAGRACGGDGFLPWARGAIRNHSRFLARSAGRRRAREAVHYDLHDGGQDRSGEAVGGRIPDAVIASLSPAVRVLALLVNLGMGKVEIAHLLGLGDPALRQRVHALRKAVAQAGAAIERDGPHGEPAGAPGLARRNLKAAIPARGARRFAVRDPDGMGIFFSVAHVPGRGGNR